MGARLINNPRRTNIGHVEDFPVLHMRSLRKSAVFNEGQRTEGHFRYPGASNANTIIVDLRSEHDLKVLLKVEHADSATNMQVIGLTHRPTGFNGRRWYFVSTNGETYVWRGTRDAETSEADAQLFRVESERRELSAPLSRGIAEPLDADAAGQAAFNGCLDQIGREEGERDGHIDLSSAAFLARAKLCDRGHPTQDNIIQPST